jgi:hypothetical protein
MMLFNISFILNDRLCPYMTTLEAMENEHVKCATKGDFLS